MLLSILLALPGSSEGQQSGTLFRGARVFDGTRMLEGRDVLVQNGLVTQVGRGLRAPSGVEVIDASGKTLMPGLIDAHTHTFTEAILREAVVFGVTTHLDMFTDHRFAKAMRDAQLARTSTGRADLFSAGTLVTAPKGHGTQMGMTIPTITSPDSAQAFVDARIAEGSDYIKIVFDDGHAYGLRFGTFDRTTLKALITATHRRGKLAVVHIGDAASARTAIEAGADGLVHLFTAGAEDPDFARLAGAKRAFVIPTMTVLQSIVGVAGGGPLLEDERMTRYLALSSRQNMKQGFPVRAGAAPVNHEIANSTVRQLRARGFESLPAVTRPTRERGSAQRCTANSSFWSPPGSRRARRSLPQPALRPMHSA